MIYSRRRRRGGVWAHTAICWRETQPQHQTLLSHHHTGRRARTPQHGSRKMSPATSRTNSARIRTDWTKEKDKNTSQNVELGVSGRAVKRWRGERRGSSLNLEENSMFPGLVRLVSMVLLVSMVFHQAHLATALNTLNDSGGSPRTKNTGWVWERGCSQGREALRDSQDGNIYKKRTQNKTEIWNMNSFLTGLIYQMCRSRTLTVQRSKVRTHMNTAGTPTDVWI